MRFKGQQSDLLTQVRLVSNLYKSIFSINSKID